MLYGPPGVKRFVIANYQRRFPLYLLVQLPWVWRRLPVPPRMLEEGPKRGPFEAGDPEGYSLCSVLSPEGRPMYTPASHEVYTSHKILTRICINHENIVLRPDGTQKAIAPKSHRRVGLTCSTSLRTQVEKVLSLTCNLLCNFDATRQDIKILGFHIGI